MENTKICEHFLLKKRIGGGSFGEIYAAEDTRTHKPVAVKLESNQLSVPQLEIEARIYRRLSGNQGIPKLYHYGTDRHYNVMAIDLLGKSLEDLLVLNKCPFSLKTVLMLADQMIYCVEIVHRYNIIHRDIKPDNFVMGLGQNSTQVYIIDFGLSKQYRDPDTKIHIPFQKGKTMTGTARYASINAMRGYEQSRRDDMESLGHIFIYLLKGQLPWQGLPAHTQAEKLKKIFEVKRKTPIEELCNGLPSQFAEYMRMVRKLEYDEEPKYKEYREMFLKLLKMHGYKNDYKFDWIEPPNPPKEVKFNIKPPNEPPGRGGAFPRRFRNWNLTPRRGDHIVNRSSNKFDNRINTANPMMLSHNTTSNLPKINRPNIPQKIFHLRRMEQFVDRVE
ncbi:CK1 family protein kinase [Tritrichomonas foetus]|uniref:non-specific serine/threonine protein kinase n=1 Tax=Tritrichomonas foetus TaxID=1144522 RepID=A0A1J4KP08_9EUKA|nr:CK1 family protein kinase [Tritrichomonas foetus]|eukprot:OHT13023.1 CK1 family protein kinase [Tritrichomonas foetus]